MAEQNRAVSAPKGTYDLLPPESWRWQEVVRTAMDSFARAGYAPVDTPMFEHTEVFERGVGGASEVVQKQMFTFPDMGGRSLTLRPEGTAPVVRAVLEHRVARGALVGSVPVKLAYAGPMFRQERPQRGRYRQFFQVGIEAIGSDNPLLDAEVVEVGARFLSGVGVQATLLLNSIGHPDPSCREGYLDTLVRYLTDNRDDLAPEDRARIEINPLRTFDSKEEATAGVMAGAPSIADHLCDACRKHFAVVREELGGLGVPFEVDPTLVRGLDYYTKTAFEFVVGGLGAQNAVGGGGRYDGLSEALGGGPLPGIGFDLGIDRIRLARDEQQATPPEAGMLTAYVVAIGPEAERAALKLATRLRRAGIGADLHYAGRNVKGQMKEAARSGAPWAVILGADELAEGRATIKNLSNQEQKTVAVDELEEHLSR